MTKFLKAELGELKKVKRAMIMEKVKSTGCEVSINNLQKGQGSPFLHSHKLNEEVFIITKGKGLLELDGNEVEVSEGSVIRIDPEVIRGIKAIEDIQFICIQSQKDSLSQATREDGIIH